MTLKIARRTAVGSLLAGTIFGVPARAQTPGQGPAWPRVIEIGDASVTLYQPQPITWPERKRLTARAALAITPKDSKDQILGTLEVAFATSVDTATSQVTLTEANLVSSQFPMLATTQAARIEARVRESLSKLGLRTIPLDTIVHGLKRTEEARPAPVNNDPPAIFYSDRPASLVVFDGPPVLAPIGATGLSFAVNTNWSVFSDGKTWYLLNGTLWLSAAAASGPYTPITRLPTAFNALPADQNFAEVKKTIPPKAGSGPAPVITVSEKPAEMILTEGSPQFVAIPGTGLQAVKNASAALFFDPRAGQFYYLTSGRWFTAKGLDGPWSFATDKLPADFALIDPEGNYGAVLPSVPNTAQAQAAVLKAQLPQQGTLKREGTTIAVTYDGGAAQFQAIPGTSVKYATNTSFQVLEVNGRYYACHEGAWFVAPAPTGAWVLAESVPQVIYTIPPSSPVYPVTYVTVQSYNPASVTYAFTAGYILGFITAGVLVRGTGYYYPPYIYPGRVPIYRPYPYTYAGAAYYNPATGAWVRGGAVYGPYYGARGGAAYNPSTGAWARGGAVYGPYGGAAGFSAYNPSTGSYVRGGASWNAYGGTATATAYNAQTGRGVTTTQNTNMYQRWGSSTITTPTQTINTASVSGASGSAGTFSSSTGAQGAGVNTARGGTAAVKTGSGDVYAGHDGNVYRHTDSGWQSYDNGSWQSVQKPTNQPAAQTRSPAEAQRQAPSQATPNVQRPTNAQTQRPTTTQSPTLSQSNFQQLEQDRQARFAGRTTQTTRQAPSGGGFQGRAAEGRPHR